jgi:hypothetical protein
VLALANKIDGDAKIRLCTNAAAFDSPSDFVLHDHDRTIVVRVLRTIGTVLGLIDNVDPRRPASSPVASHVASFIEPPAAASPSPSSKSYRVPVPCGGCKACCHRERIVLAPDETGYVTEPALGPDVPGDARMLAHKPNGDCIYLGEQGCTIWESAPRVCQAFDCRRWLAKIDYPKELMPDDLDGEVAAAARRLLSKEQVRAKP